MPLSKPRLARRLHSEGMHGFTKVSRPVDWYRLVTLTGRHLGAVKDKNMTATGEPLLKTHPEVDVRAWQFLIDTSKVSFGTMAVFASATTARSAAGLSTIS
jgi:hypothetical protein